MKHFLLALLIVLIIGAVLFVAVALGPLKKFIPQSTQETFSLIIPDYFTGDRGASPQTNTQLPSSSGAQTQEPVWEFKGSDGTVINVSPFVATSTAPGGQPTQPTQSTQPAPPTQNIDIVGTNEPLSPYIISYVASDQSFNIGLFKEPLGEVRKQAEQEFLVRLKISEAEACRLKYVVVTPFWVSTFYGGKNLGFSFCPGATKF